MCNKGIEIMGTNIETIKVLKKSDKEIVFASRQDLIKFYDDINGGKNVILMIDDGNEIQTEMINPNLAPFVNDGQVILKSVEKKH
jgi:6-phosphogluconate dehydrogenase